MSHLHFLYRKVILLASMCHITITYGEPMFLQTWYYMNIREWLLTIRLREELRHAHCSRPCGQRICVVLDAVAREASMILTLLAHNLCDGNCLGL